MHRYSRRRSFPRASLLLLLPLLFLLTAPLPLPRGVAQAVPRAASAYPTAQIQIATAVAVVSTAMIPTPVPRATAQPTDTPSPLVATASETPVAPTATIAPSPSTEPSATAVPSPQYIIVPSATLPARLDLPPTQIPTEPAALPPPTPVAAVEQVPPGVPVAITTLMYHYVRVVDQANDPLGFNLSVTPEHLQQQLDWLVARGYTTVTMETVAQCMSGRSPHSCPSHAIALTFDDGYDDAFSTVLPALQQRGMVATFYVISGFVGHPGYLSWDQVRALHAAGMEIGSHTVTHLDLSTLPLDQVRSELVESKAQIEAQVGVPVTSFCYPSGRFNAGVVALVGEAGYTNATTTMPYEPQPNLLLLPRLRVEGRYGLAEYQGIVP